MKVIMLNGSPHTNGNTALALREMAEVLEAEDIKTEIITVGNQKVHGCTACYACAKLGKCAFDDIVNKIAPKFRRASGLVIGSPVYYAGANATLCAVLDRLFFSTCFDKAMKVGASVVVGRRWLPASIGTAYTDKNPVKYCKMKKECKACVRWRTIWRF